MRLFSLRLSASLCLLLFLLTAPCRSAAAQSNAEGIAKMVSLMQADGYSYKTTSSPTVWTIHLAGAHIKDIKVVLAIGGDPDSDLIVFTTVVEKQYMPVTVDFMRYLLEQDHQMDRVKIAYDADGDLEVRIDSSLRLVDAAELRRIVDHVKNVSDELYGHIESSLVGPNPHPYSQ
jgi:hypothetical protein